MTQIFVDTWAWYALVDVADNDHALAQIANEDLLNAGYTFVTTNFILAETLTLIRYTIGHSVAVQFRSMLDELIETQLVKFIRVDENQENQAWTLFQHFADQKFSYVDCTSFVVMQHLNINEVFTADHHFMIMGFTLVP